MDIRKKTVVILCFAIACLILVLLVLSEAVVLDGFSRVEYQSAQKDTNRVIVALGNDINTLDAVAQDWASRDNTRMVLLAPHTSSWDELEPTTFELLQFNYILLADTNGTVVLGKGYDLGHHAEKPVPRVLTGLLLSSQIHFGIKNEFGTMGIVQSPEGPLMLAVCPVFSATEKEQVTGYILMGRDLDEAEVSRLSSLVQLPLDLQPYQQTGLFPDFSQAISHFPSSSSPFIRREGKDALTIDAPVFILPQGKLLSSYSQVRDLFGQPILILKVSIVRDIYEQGTATTLYFLGLLIVAGLVFGLVILLLLEKTVLSRILYLSKRMNEIGKTKDFSARVVMSGKDEIGTLTDNVNGMLGELETSRDQIQGRLIQSEEKYRLFFNSITDPVIIFRYGQQNNCTLIIEANEAAATLLGYSREDLLTMSSPEIMGRDICEEKMGLMLPHAAGFTQHESAYRTKSGKLIPVEINARVFDEFGQKAILMIARDITDRQMADKALARAQKKLSLLNSVTFNDIQNALFAIRGYINLQSELSRDEKINEYLDKENGALKRISGSLDFARQYQDLGTKPPQWQNVQQSFIMGISHLDFSSVQRIVHLDNLEIYADPLLEQVFFTFAANVLNHAKNASQVTIRYEMSENLILFFEDNGNGVPDDMKEQIFLRGYGPQKNMGLFLVREILEITGITIRETGIYGNGARFEIIVPVGSFRFNGKKE